MSSAWRRRSPVVVAVGRDATCAVALAQRSRMRRLSDASRGGRRRSALERADYDGRFAFMRLRYGAAPRGGASAASRLGARLPARRLHFLKILERADVRARRIVDQGNILTLDDPDLCEFSDRLHVGAGLLDDERSEKRGAAQLPAQGRLHHLRRLPRRRICTT